MFHKEHFEKNSWSRHCVGEAVKKYKCKANIIFGRVAPLKIPQTCPSRLERVAENCNVA